MNPKKYENFETLEERHFKEEALKKYFGENLRIYLYSNKISVKSLADLINYDPQHIYGILNGRKAPSLFCLNRILDALNISFKYLLTYNNQSINRESLEAVKALLNEKIDQISNEDILSYLIIEIDFFNKLKN